MELNKTKCHSCGHLNRWYSFKWPDAEWKQHHNQRNSTECPKCGSRDVVDIEDEEVMELYSTAVKMLFGHKN